MDIFHDPVFRSLEKLGFSVNESKVYLTLLHLGPSLAGIIAKEARLDRSSTYNALKLLVERGIISTVHETTRTLYVPVDPKKIVDYFKEKEEIAQRIIPELKAHFTATKEKQNVLLFKGYKGVKTIFQDLLDTSKKNDEYYVLGSEGQFGERMPYYAPLFRKLKEAKGIKTKMLIREGREKLSKGKNTEYRQVPSEAISPATINIYDGKVAIFIWGDATEAILIENERVSKTLKSYFDFMWKYAKK